MTIEEWLDKNHTLLLPYNGQRVAVDPNQGVVAVARTYKEVIAAVKSENIDLDNIYIFNVCADELCPE